MFFSSWTITYPLRFQTVKIWIKIELSDISEFSILSIEQNRLLGNLGNFPLCSKSYWNLLVFVSIDFYDLFKSWITISALIRGQHNFQDFRAFNLGYRAKWKTGKFRKLFFFSFKSYRNFSVFRSVHKITSRYIKTFWHNNSFWKIES